MSTLARFVFAMLGVVVSWAIVAVLIPGGAL